MNWNQIKPIDLCNGHVLLDINDPGLNVPENAIGFGSVATWNFCQWLKENNFGYFGGPREHFRGYWQERAIEANPEKSVIIVEDLS